MNRHRIIKRLLVWSIPFLILLSFTSVHAVQHYSLATGSPAAVYYYLGAGFANLFAQYLPDVRMTVESTAGSAENVNLINRGKVDFGFSAPTIIKAMMDQKKFDPQNLAIMCIGHATVGQWLVRKESPIQSVRDFRGKRIAVGPPGSGTLVSIKKTLELGWNIKFEEIKPAYLSHNEFVEALKDGTVDSGKLDAGIPTSSILDLSRSIPIRILNVEKDAIARIIENDPGQIPYVIPGKTYTGVDEDVMAYAGVAGIFCRKDLSEDVVYNMLKVLYEHPQERDPIHPCAREYVPQNALLGTGWIIKYIPPHPGLVKYLKEKKLWKD